MIDAWNMLPGTRYYIPGTRYLLDRPENLLLYLDCYCKKNVKATRCIACRPAEPPILLPGTWYMTGDTKKCRGTSVSVLGPFRHRVWRDYDSFEHQQTAQQSRYMPQQYQTNCTRAAAASAATAAAELLRCFPIYTRIILQCS